MDLAQDVRYGLRMMRKSPGFTAITALTLALGIGANTAMFSVVDSVLFRPLPHRDASRLMMVFETPPSGQRNGVSAANFLDWRDQNRSFANLAGTAIANFNLSGKDRPERVTGMRTSWDFFEMLGVAPALGRGFVADDDRPGAPRVALLSHALWQRKFGGDPRAVGSDLTVDGAKCTVAGVLPPSFRFFGAPEMWVPLALDRATATRAFHFLLPVARLKPGVTLAQAQAEMDGIAANIARAYPQSNRGWGVAVDPLREAMLAISRGSQRQSVPVLFGAVGFVLLIACANVAGLLLAKAAVRSRELAVRASLGAGRARLLRQLLTESVLLALAGGLAGSLLAFWLVKAVRGLVPPFARAGLAEIAVDGRVLAFTLAVSVVTGLFFGVFPAWRASRPDLHGTLKQGGRGSAGGGPTRFRGALVVAEIAFSLMLLIGAGLMIRSLMALRNADLGFRPDHLLTMRLSMPKARYSTAAAVRAFYRQAIAKTSAIPGVRDASISMGLPVLGAGFEMAFQIAGRPQVPFSEAPAAPFELVTHEFFRTMGISLRQGRFFNEHDSENAPPVAIVNEAFVKRFLPGDQPLEQRLLIRELIPGKLQLGPPIAWQIAGVIADVKFRGLDAAPNPIIYVPIMQSPSPGAALALRTATGPLSVATAARAALEQLDPDMPVTSVQTMHQIMDNSMSQPRTQTWLIGALAAVALALAALGIYGLMSYSVAQSTHDLGVRIALGASAGDVLRLVLSRGMLLAGAGLLLGLGGALALNRVLSTLLFGVTATDPWTFVSVSVLLALVALAAAFIPARRATRIDPVAALRFE